MRYSSYEKPLKTMTMIWSIMLGLQSKNYSGKVALALSTKIRLNSLQGAEYSSVIRCKHGSSFKFDGIFKRKHFAVRSRTENIVGLHSQTTISMTETQKLMYEHAKMIIQAGITAVDPCIAIKSILTAKAGISLVVDDPSLGVRHTYNAENYDNVLIIAFGKASAAMAITACELAKQAFPGLETSGVVIVKDDHASEKDLKDLERYNVVVREASHPIPDERGVEASKLILEKVIDAKERTLVLCCISGGGSALFCLPRPPLTLNDLAKVNKVLQSSGMDITKINVIRKKLELGKGGRLAVAAYPATVCSLVLSDIIGDPLDLIASGPTVPDDGSTWQDASDLIQKFGLHSKLPSTVMQMVQDGVNGELSDTPKSSHAAFSTKQQDSTSNLCETILVGNNEKAVMAAAEEASKLGYNAVVLGTRIDGEARHVGRVYANMAAQLAAGKKRPFQMADLPAALIAGGETTVTLPVDNEGKGGRNQELGLAAALCLQENDLQTVTIASVGTDGTDGPTDAAGVIVDSNTVQRTEMSANDALNKHDAYNFFDSISQNEDYPPLLKTGATGTNVADIAVILVR